MLSTILESVRKPIILSSLLGCAVIFLSTINFATLMIRFLAVGEIPGTSVVIPSNGMFAILGLIAALAILSLLPSAQRQHISRSASYTLPKKRYTHL